MTADEIVAERVVMALFRRKMTKRSLARLLGVSEQSVGKKINGRSTFSLDELLLMSRHFDMPISDLLPDETYEPVPGLGRRTPPSPVAARRAAGDFDASKVGFFRRPDEGYGFDDPIRRTGKYSESAQRPGRHLRIVGRIPTGDPLPTRREPEARPYLRLIGGAA